MKKRCRSIFVCALCVLMVLSMTPACCFAAQAAGSQADAWNALEAQTEEKTEDLDESDYDGYIVSLRDDLKNSTYSRADEQAEEADGVETIEYADGMYVIEDVEDAQQITAASNIDYIEPNYTVELYDSQTKAAVSDPSPDDNAAHLALMNADTVRDEYGIAGEDLDTETDMGGDSEYTDQIVIGLIDSGLDPDHEDLDYSHVLEGESFVGTSTTSDTMGHGSFVAGEILASCSNGLGIDGIAPDTYIMPLKVFTSGSTTNSVIINAINYAVEQKTAFDAGEGGANISVINMSLGSSSSATALKSAVESAIAANIIVVCAAGNDEDTSASYPAQYAIGIGSTTSDGIRDYYSQILSSSNGTGWENKVWVSAPGSNYTSLYYDGGYYKGSGTSFSSPQAAALAAVSLSLCNDLTTKADGTSNNHEAFKALLKQTAQYVSHGRTMAYNSSTKSTYEGTEASDPILESGQNIYYGWGIIDYAAMVEKLVAYSENEGTEVTVSFDIDNGAGTTLTSEKNNLNIEVRAYGEDGTLSDTIVKPESDGTYKLTFGTCYQYTVTANKYTTVTKKVTPLSSSRVIQISMEGIDYYTSFDVRNTDGKVVTDAEITVQKSSGAKITQNESDATFATKNGTYTYIVSAPGYFPYKGTFTINDEENEYPDLKNEISVVLTGAQDICSVTFEISGSDDDPNAEVTVKDSSGNILDPYDDGAWKLEPGDYTYTAVSDYYKTIEGSFTITDSEKGTERVIKDEMTQRIYWTFFDIVPISALEATTTTITVLDSDGNVVDPFQNSKGEYRIVNGSYTYTVKAEGYKKEKGSFTVKGSILYIDIELVEGEDKENGDSGDPDGSTGDNTGGSTGDNSGSSSGGSSGGSSGTSHKVTTPDTTGGTVAVDKTDAQPGENVTITITPESGKTLDSITLTDSAGNELTLTKRSDTVYTFTMPKTAVSISAEFKDGDTASGKYSDIETIYHNLTDVPAGSWYYEPVNYIMTVGLFKGMTETEFGPNENMSRGMLVTVLYRLAQTEAADSTGNESGDSTETDAGAADGTESSALLADSSAAQDSVTVTAENIANCPFTDVASGAYYAEAVAWAYKNGVVAGIDSTHFAPNAEITREQITVMLRNYASWSGMSTTVNGDGAEQTFKDYASVSAYAKTAVSWAFEQSIVNGDDTGNFNPQKSATRAEVAVMMTNFLTELL